MSRWLLAGVVVIGVAASAPAAPLLGTKPLTEEGDLAARMVAGIDRYLMRELADSPARRQPYWKPDFSSAEAYTRSLQPNRDHLRKIIGAVDPRLPVKMELVATTDQPALVAETDLYQVFAVRWPVFEGVDGEGLLLEPKKKAYANVVAIPDADWTPEMFIGMAPGLPVSLQYARFKAERGFRVIIPVLIDRKDSGSGNPRLGRRTNQPHREFIYRMAFEMGRHIIGYEVQKVLSLLDWLEQQPVENPASDTEVFGYGEGGLLALYTGAVSTRRLHLGVAGYFQPREGIWREPIYRNVWGLLRRFGDAEMLFFSAANLGHRLTIYGDREPLELVPGPPAPTKGRSGAAPGQVRIPEFQQSLEELRRAEKTYALPLAVETRGRWPSEGDTIPTTPKGQPPADRRKDFDPAVRQHRQFDQLVQYTQKLMRQSEAVRREFFWSRLGGLTSPARLEEYEKSIEPLRAYFWEEVIGKLPDPVMPLNPRTRLAYDEPRWRGYEVMVDVYPDVFAYGILCVPKDLKAGEKRPVVVCQHGLEGRPQDVVNPREKTRAYNSFGAQLADRGYVVYAPQNPYIGGNTFRQLQRKANPLKLSLFSFIVRQHERTLDWLQTLPFVDPDRIAFYGLSYGGKTAMRVPAIEKRYRLSICSGDFNEWIVKNVSVDFAGSYMFTGEYEMFEFDLGNTFNYAEMVALIAPRPFMVERGHEDGVGIDEMVAYEYAKVRRHYARLGIAERTAIEFFPGRHEINGQGTFEFLQQHLKWPR